MICSEEERKRPNIAALEVSINSTVYSPLNNQVMSPQLYSLFMCSFELVSASQVHHSDTACQDGH